MEKLRSITDFRSLEGRIAAYMKPDVPCIVIPAGTCGQASGANELIRATKRELLATGLRDRVNVRITGCHGFCQMEPSVLVLPRGTFYPRVRTEDMVHIVEAVSREEVIESLLYTDSSSGRRIERQSDVPFFKAQTRTLLGRNEHVDPIRIFSYLETGGYSGLAKVLEENRPEQV